MIHAICAPGWDPNQKSKFIKLIIAKSNFSKEQNNHVSHVTILGIFIIQFCYKDLKFYFPKIYKFHFPKIYFCLSYPH